MIKRIQNFTSSIYYTITIGIFSSKLKFKRLLFSENYNKISKIDFVEL